jgi:hypothetical protein
MQEIGLCDVVLASVGRTDGTDWPQSTEFAK